MQAVQALLLVVLVTKPAGHDVHTSAPVDAANRPALHAAHVIALLLEAL